MKKKAIICFSIVIFSVLVQAQSISYSVDGFPTNIGGKAELKRIFEQELVYPAVALEKKIGGKVNIAFVVKADSTSSDVRISESVSPEIDAEALRIFRLIQWVPSIKEGKRVSVQWAVSFEFDPAKYAKICKKRGYTNFSYNKQYTVDSSQKICKTPEQIPIYYKGGYAFEDFIKQNLEYPKQAQLANIQGVVRVRFVVEPSGLITNIGVEKSVGGGCDQEAMRLIELTKWQPAVNNGKWVRYQMVVPIYFRLNEEFKDNSAGEQK
jgi:TonB family protein